MQYSSFPRPPSPAVNPRAVADMKNTTRFMLSLLVALLITPAASVGQSVEGRWDGEVRVPGQVLEIPVGGDGLQAVVQESGPRSKPPDPCSRCEEEDRYTNVGCSWSDSSEAV